MPPRRHLRSHFFRILPILLVLLALASVPCCRSTGADLSFRSRTNEAVLVPRFKVQAYIPIDRNTADIYLSDIPLTRLADDADDLSPRWATSCTSTSS